jgi:hypothetical protein
MDPGAGPGGLGAGPPPMGGPSGSFPASAPGAAPFHPSGFGLTGMGAYPGAAFEGLGPAGGYISAPGVMHPGSGFDSRTEAAFSGASAGGPGSQSAGPSGFSTNGGSVSGSGFDGGADPFGFLGTGLAGLSLDENNGRRNGAHGPGGPGGKPPTA